MGREGRWSIMNVQGHLSPSFRWHALSCVGHFCGCCIVNINVRPNNSAAPVLLRRRSGDQIDLYPRTDTVARSTPARAVTRERTRKDGMTVDAAPRYVTRTTRRETPGVVTQYGPAMSTRSNSTGLKMTTYLSKPHTGSRFVRETYQTDETSHDN